MIKFLGIECRVANHKVNICKFDYVLLSLEARTSLYMNKSHLSFREENSSNLEA
ncbi:hypothetical protein L3N51_02407 [Metallosphaera sp. J1]|nr:hypothetical protein [Metallosphaera javensis (ex Hofmann et al. 2022)]